MFPRQPAPRTLPDEVCAHAIFDRLARREFMRQGSAVTAGVRNGMLERRLALSADAAPQPAGAFTDIVAAAELDSATFIDDLARLDDVAAEQFDFMYSSRHEEIAFF